MIDYWRICSTMTLSTSCNLTTLDTFETRWHLQPVTFETYVWTTLTYLSVDDICDMQHEASVTSWHLTHFNDNEYIRDEMTLTSPLAEDIPCNRLMTPLKTTHSMSFTWYWVTSDNPRCNMRTDMVYVMMMTDRMKYMIQHVLVVDWARILQSRVKIGSLQKTKFEPGRVTARNITVAKFN